MIDTFADNGQSMEARFSLVTAGNAYGNILIPLNACVGKTSRACDEIFVNQSPRLESSPARFAP
jgi:hypothetical protein